MKLPRVLAPVLFLHCILIVLCVPTIRAENASGLPIRLYMREVSLTVFGKQAKVLVIEQDGGVQGFEPQTASGFNVEVINQLKEPTSIHWHGLVLPALMDGVPFVSQEPIPPNGKFHYQFPLKQSGTYWMHSHFGLQEQSLGTAPLILQTKEQEAKANEQYVVLLGDFSFKPSSQILKELKAGMKKMKGMGETKGMGGMKEMPKSQTLVAQKWDDAAQRFTATSVDSELPDTDVKYDALLANRRTLDDPQVFRVKPGHTVLLRLIAGSSATNFFVNTGALTAELTAVDGQDILPLAGNFFQLGIAQRIDLLITIPDQGGVFPIIAQGEGTRQQCGVVLATEGNAVPKIPVEARFSAAGLDNTQELRLKAKNPLPEKPADRSLPCVLGGNMANYSWTINGFAYPNNNSLNVKQGERVEIVMRNDTGMSHPMHLHGHDFQVIEIDGQKVNGAVRDTLIVPPQSTIKVIFDANNPGVWAFHCHILYHLAAGMFTVLKYEGANTEFWQPDKTLSELATLAPER
jgi:FtsP/CotA-like multicopper oxidase with cupredoxin domain